DEDGNFPQRIIRISENNVRIVIDNCHLDKDSQSAFRNDGTGISLFLTNSIVSNIGFTESPDNGRVLDDRGNQIDTVWFHNNTFYNITSQVIRDAGSLINYAYYRQNTAYNIGKNQAVELGPVVEAVVEDNLFINSSFFGYDSDDDDALYVIGLDSLTQTEIDSLGPQSFTANNNNIFLSASITDAYPDTVMAPVNFNPTAAAYIEEQGSGATFINEDITFTNSPGTPAAIVTDFWNDAEDPAEFDNANAPFDFAYADTFTSYSGGSDGQQLGSLTWFGTLVNNEEDGPSLTIPSVFQLHGNYPNPFNPSTNISFNLAEAADVSVDVFNMIGQKVMSIPVQRMAAGANQSVTVDASFLSSGIYIYRVNAKAGNVVTTNSGRMTLIK
ncbi:MAG: T9SS type A sorting domain-containing protein, partial [Balneolales bacterium]|nr:T9SS type A sorting domain-containing protein [Balneolales bacterium]